MADTTSATKDPAFEESKDNIIKRLRRIEGQVRGLQKMVEDERDCHEILTLFSGVRRALEATGDLVLETYLVKCAAGPETARIDTEEMIRALKLARR